MPSGWSGDCVRMERTIASRSAIAAIFGRYSHTGTPGTLDGCGRNGPAVGRPGFMSNVSIWLAPPLAHRRMQRLPRFAASAAAVRAWNSPPQLATAPPAVTRAPLRKARRARGEAGLKGVMWMPIRNRRLVLTARDADDADDADSRGSIRDQICSDLCKSASS